jgi:hypothetical protein
VGNATTPWAESLASLASKLRALSAFLIGWISAMGLPRSVIMTSFALFGAPQILGQTIFEFLDTDSAHKENLSGSYRRYFG